MFTTLQTHRATHKAVANEERSFAPVKPYPDSQSADTQQRKPVDMITSVAIWLYLPSWELNPEITKNQASAARLMEMLDAEVRFIQPNVK